MKRSVILLALSLLTTIAIFSQNTYPKNLNDSLVIITADQLKQANLIFLEHSYLLEENRMLNEELNVKDEMLYNFEELDSINSEKILKLTEEVDFNRNKVVKLENKYKTTCLIGGGALIAAIVAFLLK